MEKTVCYSPQEEGFGTRGAAGRSPRVRQKAEEENRTVDKRLYCGFCRKQCSRQGKQV